MKRIILPIVVFLISHFSNAQVCTKAQLPTNLQNGLVAFYPFCGNANDGSGNLLNATLNQGTLVQDRFGNTSSAISLNGTSQLIEFPINSSYNTSTFSVSFWTKGNSYNIHNKVQLGVAGGALRWSLNWNETNNYYSPMTCAGGYAANSNSFNSGIPLRQWNHIVYVVEGTSTKVYKNGVYDGVQNTASALTCFNTSMKLCFGGDIGGGSVEYYDGAFDDIFFYDRAISSSEVSQLFLTTNTGCNTPDITNFIPFSAQSSICGTATTLNAGAGYTSYLWSTGATSQTISATTPGEYRVTVTNAAGCSASDTISVNFIKADIIQANQTVCANTTLNLFIDSTFSGSVINAKSQMSANLQTGLVAFYPFTGNASDVSGNNNVLTANGVTLTTDRFGRSNSAYSFTNTQTSVTNYLKAVNPTPFAKNTYTISAWFNSRQFYPNIGGVTYNYQSIVFYSPQWYVYGPAYHLALQHANNSVLEGGNWTTTNTNQGVTTANGSIVVNQWYHVVLSFDGTTIKMYKDGQLVGSRAATVSYANQIQFLIGGAGDGPSPGGIYGGFNGKIDDVGFWDRALTYNEIQELYIGRPSVLWSTSETTNKISVTPAVTTKYYATLTDGIATCTDSVTITIDNIAAFNPFPAQLTSCGTTKSLDAGAGYTNYLWNTGVTSQTISSTVNGDYSVTVTNAAGCSASDTVTVSIVKADILQNNATICKGASITLSVDSSFAAQGLINLNLLPANLKVGLKAYYPFSGNANDASGNNNNGIVTGATLTADRFGNANSAYSFNGSSFIDLGNISGVGYSASQDITTSFWINEGAIGTVISKYTNLDAANSNFFFSKAANTAQVAGDGTNSFSANNITDYRWTNYVLIASAGSNKSFLYRNGILIATGTLNANGALSATKLMLGKLMGSPSNFFTGKMDDVFIYNRVLTVAEIAQLSNFQPKVSWSNGATTNTISVSPMVTTKYFATITDGITTCRDSVTITVNDLSAFNPLQDTVKVCGDSTILDAGAGYATYNWSNGATSRSITLKASGKYYVTVSSLAGCSASDTSVVSIVNAKILQRDTIICKGSSIIIAVNNLISANVACNKSSLPLNLQNSLVAYYPFCGNANDVSGNGNSGTVYNAQLTTDRFGNANSAYYFNGTNAYMASFPTFTPYPLSVSLWVKPEAFDKLRTIFQWNSDNQANSGTHSPDLYFEGGNFGFHTWTTTRGDVSILSDSTYNTPKWYHVVTTHVNDTIRFYINGVLQAQFDVNNSSHFQPYFILAKYLSCGGNCDYYKGVLDDIFIFNKALSANEIQQLYNSSSSVTWSTGATSNSIFVAPTTTTKYFVTVSDGITTCTDSVTITVDDLSGFNPLQDTIKVCGDSTILDAGAGFATYKWSNGLTTRTITAKASGKYIVTVANASGCSASDTSVVSIVKAKILQRDTTICKGGTISLSADTIANRLLAYYPLDNNAQDLSGNNMNGAVTGATPTTDRFGQANKAYFFNGTSDYIKVNHDSRLNRLPLTVSCWFNANQQISPAGALVGKYYAASWTGWQLTLNEYGPSSQRLDPWYIRSPNNYIKNSSATPNFYTTQIIDSSWHHVAFVIDSTSGKIYLDGSLQATASWVGPAGAPSNSWPMYFGYYPSGNAQPNVYYYRGKIDDIRLYDKALNISEVQSAMSSTISNIQYLWSNGATTPTIQVNPTTTTKYYVTVSDGITSCTDSVVVNVSSSDLILTNPAAVCSPGVVNLTAAAVTSGSAAGLTYTYWKDANATQALASPDKVSVSGTYYIVGTSATGCTSAPTAVKVTVNPLPVATIVTPTQTTICDKSTLTLTARGGTTYQWLYNGAAITGATDSIYAASLAGSYEVNVIALGCTSKVAAPVNLSLIKAAVPKFSNSSTCIDVPVSFFNETDTTSSGSVSWVWDFGDGQTSTLINPVYTYKKSGAYIVKLTVTPKLCLSLPANITKNITVEIPPVGIKYPDVLAVKNKATPLSARFISNGYTYLWMPSTGLNNGVIQKPLFNFSQEQLYRVRLTSASGCITMDTVKVSVYDSSDIFVPKAFSPNNDGKNDKLQPFLVNITTLKFFRVYNRWGQLMFQSSDSKQGWDGMYNYKPQPLETYTWIAEGIDGNGTTIFRKGQTVLIR